MLTLRQWQPPNRGFSRPAPRRCDPGRAALVPAGVLEIYEEKDTRKSDSPLTKFVKDLLGLDHLDALIEGVHDAGDVRRLRGSLPAYWEVREIIPRLQNEIRTDTKIAELSVQTGSTLTNIDAVERAVYFNFCFDGVGEVFVPFSI